MSFGVCPVCKKRVVRKLFRVRCDSCSTELKDAPITKTMKIVIHVLAFTVASYFVISGTPEIINNHPDNAHDVLFWYYMKLFLGALVVSGLITLFVSFNFSIYEPR